MPERRQALVEFEAIDSAILAVSKSKETPGIQLKGRTIYLNFSKSQEINRGSGGAGAGGAGGGASGGGGVSGGAGGYSGPQSAPPNRVLLISVQNPMQVPSFAARAARFVAFMCFVCRRLGWCWPRAAPQ